MSAPLILGPWAIETSKGPIPNLDDRLPRPNSLRRASEESKTAVLVASRVLEEWPAERRKDVAVYVAQQRGGLDYVTRFIETSVKEGPRFASPLHFSESVANNAATHLSLTFGFEGIVSTFIGSRVAGIQALTAACEDLETGSAEAALLVVQNFPNRQTSDAYTSLYAPGRRRRPLPPLDLARGSVAFMVRRTGAPGLRLRYAGVRCAGRTRAARRAAAGSLWKEACAAVGEEASVQASAFCLEFREGTSLVAETVGRAIQQGPEPEEQFALDPFLRLFRGAESGPSAVFTLSDEGSVGLVAAARG